MRDSEWGISQRMGNSECGRGDGGGIFRLRLRIRCSSFVVILAQLTRIVVERDSWSTPDEIVQEHSQTRNTSLCCRRLRPAAVRHFDDDEGVEAGGLPVMTDRQRVADEDNPKGYFELERVKQLDKGDTAWVGEAQGKVVKVISALLEYLPPAYDYRVVFIRREMSEILASQKKMLERRGEPTDRISDEELARLFSKHVQKVETWLRSQSNFSVLYVDYNKMLADPLPYVRQVNQFLGGTLDEQKMAAMVDPTLYRNRA